MENKNCIEERRKNKETVLIILATLSIIVITVGVVYAFFSYTKFGSVENSISTGNLTFLYEEKSGNGRGIMIEDAMPQDNEQSKIATKDVFDFVITSTTTSNTEIPYVVTARKSSDSSDIDEVVDLYLTNSTNSAEFLDVISYSDLEKYKNKENERIIYTGKVPSNSNGANAYNQDFRLRMWLDEKADYSQVEVTKYYCDGVEINQSDYADCETNPTTNKILEYPYNDKKFKITINVYADGVAVNTQAPIDSAKLYTSASIKNSKGGDAEIGSSVILSDYDSGYSLNDSGPVYKVYTIENGIVMQIDLCKKETPNAPAICLDGGDPTKYSLNKAALLSYFGGNENNWPSECSEEQTFFGTKELTCANSYVVLAADDSGGLFINDIEHGKSCVVNFEFGIYSCQ